MKKTINICSKFQLQQIIFIFGTNFQKKDTSGQKLNSTIEFFILELVLVPIFSLNWQFFFFGPSLSKKGISSQKQKKMNTTTEF